MSASKSEDLDRRILYRGLLDKLNKRETLQNIQIQEETNVVYQPIEGNIIPLEGINDGVFSAGIMGKGCGLQPTGEQVFAPLSGTISTVADTKHAVGIESDNGIEMLIHVGLDTVSMKGKGFSVYVKEGEKVKAGQLLMSFSKKEIASAGYPDTTAVLVINADDYEKVEVEYYGSGEAGKKLIAIQ